MSSGGSKKPKKMAHVGPNMTPMVDVVMCILIFFMLGATFLSPEMFLTSNMPAIDKAGLGTVQGDQKLPSVRMNIVMRRQGNDTWVSAFDSALLKMNKIDDETSRKQNPVVKNPPLKSLKASQKIWRYKYESTSFSVTSVIFLFKSQQR